MLLLNRIAHLLSRLLAVGSAYIYIYIYIYQVVTRFYLNNRLNMSHAYTSPLAPVAHPHGANPKTSMPHLYIIGDEPQVAWSVEATAHRVCKALALPANIF